MKNLKIYANKINVGNAGFFIGTIVLFVSSILAIQFVHKQFGAYDLSPMIDLSWRLANNQIPSIDFINTMPPILIVFIKFVSWGNLSWVDLTITNILATCAAFLFLYLVSDIKNESIWWGISIAVILAIPLVYSNHIWSSSISQLSGIIFFYAVYNAINSNHLRTKVILSVLLSSGFLAISKQNIALPMILTTVVFLLFLKHPHRMLLILIIFLGALNGVVLSMLYLGYSLHGFIYTYSAVLGRIKPSLLMLYFATMPYSNYPLPLLMLSLVSLFIYSIYERRNNISKVNTIYFLTILAVSLIPIITDWDCKLNDVSLPLFILTTGIFSNMGLPMDHSVSLQDRSFTSRRLITLAIILIIYSISILFGYIRERMFLCGPFFEFNENVIINKGYFSGLKTGKTFLKVLEEITRAKNEYNNHKIFFGTHMEFGYLYTKTPSPRGMPLWWHPGTSYGLFDEKKIIENFIRSKFDVVIFLKDYRFRMPPEISIFIMDNYLMDNKYKFIDLFLTNNPNSPLRHYKQGNDYNELGQYKLAIEEYNKAIRVQSDYFPAYFNRGIIHSKLGHYQQAIEDYTEVIRLKPDYAEAYNNRSSIYLTQGNTRPGCLDAHKACNLGACRMLKLAQSNKICH